MNKTTRTVLFFSCLAIFLILCPIILAYSIGYTFDVSNKKIVPTGSISIKSIPKGSTISVNRIEIEKVTPALITNLSAGSYDIEVFRDGYFPWNKTLQVTDFHLTVADYVLLFQKNPHSQEITNSLQWVRFSPSRSFAIGIQKEILSPLFLNLSINEMPAFSSVDNDYKIVSIEPKSVAWSTQEKYVSFFATLNNGQKGFYFFESSDPQKITPIVSGPYSDLQIIWSSSNDDILIYSYNNQITQKNITSDEELIIADGVAQVFFNDNKIYFIQQDSGIIYTVADPWMIPSKNSEIKKEQFTEIPVPINIQYSITSLADNKFLAHGDDESVLIINRESVEKIQNNVLGIDISDQGKILTFSEHEINLISENHDLDNDEKKQLIVHLDESIKKSFWITNDHVAYLLENGNFFITELNIKLDIESNTNTISNINTISPIESSMENCWIGENSDSAYPVLYYIVDGELYKVDWEM